MMHVNNQKVIANWTAKDYANAYRDYRNNFLMIASWFSSFMPEDESDSTVYAFCWTCENFHNLGF